MYNGHANYETWNVNLWIDNDEPMYRAKIAFLHAHKAKSPGLRMLTGAAVAAFVKGMMPNGTPDFHGDASRYAKVRWAEIARSWRDEIKDWRYE